MSTEQNKQKLVNFFNHIEKLKNDLNIDLKLDIQFTADKAVFICIWPIRKLCLFKIEITLSNLKYSNFYFNTPKTKVYGYDKLVSLLFKESLKDGIYNTIFSLN
jgi:hypothetical protein